MFVRAYPGPDGATRVDVGGLARSDPAGGFDEEFAGLAEALRAAYAGTTVADDPQLTTTSPGERD